MQKAYRVLYKHTPDEESELAVSKDDIVVSSESPVDDWLEVHLYHNPQARGFVPYNFLQQLSPSEAIAYVGGAGSSLGKEDPDRNRPSNRSLRDSPRGEKRTTTPRSLFEGSRFASSGTNGGSRLSVEDLGGSSLSKPKLGSSQTGLNSGVFSTSSALGKARALDRISAMGPSGKSLLSSSNAQTFSEAFARHEQYFKEVMSQREETYKRLEKSIGNTASEISACKDKNDSLSSKISELERLIDEERRRWRDRLEAEKTALQMKVFGGPIGVDRHTPLSARSSGSGRFSQGNY